MKDLRQIKSVHKAKSGQRGMGNDCYGKSAEHLILKVPVGTIIRDLNGTIVADLDEEGMKFIAARGGAGGHGNPYFKSETNQTPLICESGAEGEKNQYLLEIKSMAHMGLVIRRKNYFLRSNLNSELPQVGIQGFLLKLLEEIFRIHIRKFRFFGVFFCLRHKL